MATFLNKKQVAELLGISEPTVANWMRSGVLQEGTHWTRPGGNRLYFNKAAIEALLPGNQA